MSKKTGHINRKLFFFLGGRDLEMSTIRQLLEEHAPGQFLDKELSWGAKASDYQVEIDAVVHDGKIPVLIELYVSGPLPYEHVIIDHHNERAGRDMPTALEQVFDLLQLDRDRYWTRWHELVAANDRGHILGLKAVGANYDDVRKVRDADRKAQGVTGEQERQVREDLKTLRVEGQLTVVTIPNNASSVVTDFLSPEFGGPGFNNLLVIEPNQVEFFGDGRIVENLKEEFPASWRGGALPESGFWGCEVAHSREKATRIAFIRRCASV